MEPVTGLVIVDEISMLDTSLAAAMLSRISPAAQILLVGDPDQLPSVGPGAVLRDLLIANTIPRVHLDHVYRNEAGIAVNAARMRAGQNILDLPDCQIIPSDSPDSALVQVLAAVSNYRDALVLTPTNDGPCGRYALNALLQPILNPGKQGTGIVQYAGSTKDPDGTMEKRQEELCLGDRVMVTRNHSELGVFNGQTGMVVDLMVPRSLDVEIDGEVITFAGEDRRLLTLAYAITGHKAQGSEAPTVIVPVFRSRVLSREWLYTVITRAQERCYLIGDVQAIQSCIKVQRAQERRTGLVEAITRTGGN
jgi:exodeoxyribonuclease V alpha subunit